MVKRLVDAVLDDDEPPARAEGDNDTGDQDLEAGPEDEDEEEETPQDDNPDGDQDDETAVGDEDDEPPIKQTRGKTQHAQLRARAQKAEDDKRALELQLAQARSGQGRQNQMDTPEVRKARLATMTGDEKTEFLLNEMRAEQAQERDFNRFTQADAIDKAKYDERARTNARYKRYAPDVEHRLQVLRAQGQNVPRETILKFIIGEKIVEGGDSPRVTQQRKNAAERVKNQKTNPPRARGEGGASHQGTESAARERRLARMQI